MDHMQHTTQAERGRFPWTLVGLAALGGVSALLWLGPAPHFGQALPLLFLLACPFMHLLHGHGGHAHGGSAAADPARVPVPPDAARDAAPPSHH